jgi:hypothetical protein
LVLSPDNLPAKGITRFVSFGFYADVQGKSCGGMTSYCKFPNQIINKFKRLFLLFLSSLFIFRWWFSGIEYPGQILVAHFGFSASMVFGG